MLQAARSRSTHLAALTTTRRLYYASVLPSLVSPTSPEFQHKAQGMDVLVSDLKSKIAHAKEGGGPKAQERMRSKGKRLPRERSVSNFHRLHAYTLFQTIITSGSKHPLSRTVPAGCARCVPRRKHPWCRNYHGHWTRGWEGMHDRSQRCYRKGRFILSLDGEKRRYSRVSEDLTRLP